MDTEFSDDVLEGIRRRDPAAIAECYQAFADPLYRYLLHLCGDVVLAEDLVEATFLELVEQCPALVGGPQAVRAWLFRAGRNNFLDWVRKVNRRGDVPLDEGAASQQAAGDPGPEQHAVASDDAAVIRSALRALSPDQQEVLVLRFFADLTGPEIAGVTGRRVGAVKALQHRGVRALERVLKERGQLEALEGVSIDPAGALTEQKTRTSDGVRADPHPHEPGAP